MSTTKDSPLKIARDVLLLGALLGGLNFFLSRDDIGWLEMNPTPWLLLPLLIGARYGLGAGAFTGLLCVAGIALLRAQAEGMEPWEWATRHRYVLTALVLGGVVAGEINHLLRGDIARQRRRGEDLDEQLARLRHELDVTRETRHDLQRKLALQNAPLACLDVELQKLARMDKDGWLDNLLRLLNQLAGVSSAAIYAERGGRLGRLAVLNPAPPLSENIPLDQCALAAKALEEMVVTALSDPMEISPARPFLAAVPWGDGAERGVLLVHDMPLESFEWRNLARVELILHWSHAVRAHISAVEGAGSRRLLPLEDFMLALAQALETEQVHRLPSAVLRVDFTGTEKDTREITALLPPTAMMTRLPSGSLAALLPFAGDDAAQSAARAVKERFPDARCSQYLVVGPANLENLWSHILET